MPSDLIVEVCKILEISEHPNADRLEIATIKGWQCIIPKDTFKVGDAVVYFPIDSVLSPEVEAKLFPPESKVKIKNGRIKTIRLYQRRKLWQHDRHQTSPIPPQRRAT